MAIDAGSAAIYTDFHALGRLREGARTESPEALHEVARQFEALFIQMMLKNMRAASLGDDLFDSDQSAHYRDMFDSQISVHLGQRGGFGLADLLVRQLGGDRDRFIADPHRAGYATDPEHASGVDGISGNELLGTV